MPSLFRSVSHVLLGASLCLAAHSASAQTATYTFDFQITSDMYAAYMTGPLFTAGTRGTGTASFAYQSSPSSAPTSPWGGNHSYAQTPFNVQISFGGFSLTLIDSTVAPEVYGRRGIIVQDMSNTGPMHDAILFEGFSGPVLVPNSFGDLQTQNLHTQLGFFASPDSISNLNLNQQNVASVTGNPSFTSFNIQSIDPVYYGQVNGSITNFQPQVVSSVPEPSPIYLFAIGLAGVGLFSRLRQRAGQA